MFFPNSIKIEFAIDKRSYHNSFQLLIIDREEQGTNDILYMHVLDHFATREISTSPIRVSRYSLDFLLTNLSGKDILLPGSFFHSEFNVGILNSVPVHQEPHEVVIYVYFHGIVSLDKEYRKLETQYRS